MGAQPGDLGPSVALAGQGGRGQSGGVGGGLGPLDATGHLARVLRVHTPAAISPIDAGVSDDPRRLGFGLRTITLER